MSTDRNDSPLINLPLELRRLIYNHAVGGDKKAGPWRIIIDVNAMKAWCDECGFSVAIGRDGNNTALDTTSTTNQTDSSKQEEEDEHAADDEGRSVAPIPSLNTSKPAISHTHCDDAAGEQNSINDACRLDSLLNLAKTCQQIRCEPESLHDGLVKLFFQPPTTPSFTRVREMPFGLATYILSYARSVEWDVLDLEACLDLLQVERQTLFSIAGDSFSLEMVRNYDARASTTREDKVAAKTPRDTAVTSEMTDEDSHTTRWEAAWDIDNNPSNDQASPYQTETIRDAVQAHLCSADFDITTLRLLEMVLIDFAKTHPVYADLILRKAIEKSLPNMTESERELLAGAEARNEDVAAWWRTSQ